MDEAIKQARERRALAQDFFAANPGQWSVSDGNMRYTSDGREFAVQPKTHIVWNGVDGYIDLAGDCRDYDITRHSDGTATLYTSRQSFESIRVEPVDRALVPTDGDGELILDGLYVTIDFRLWRPA